jgi:hypothetical protein
MAREHENRRHPFSYNIIYLHSLAVFLLYNYFLLAISTTLLRWFTSVLITDSLVCVYRFVVLASACLNVS